MTKDILETLGALGIQTNANEVMNTAAGGGENTVPTVLAQEVFDAIPEYSTFLKDLPGYHGANLDKTQEVPVIGDVGLMALGSEKTTGAHALAQGTVTAPLGKVTISQKKMFMTIDVSDELSRFNVIGAEKFEELLKQKLAASAARTVEAYIINGDVETGATGNVNKDDGAPGGTEYYLGADGLRKEAIVTGTGLTVNAGTFDFADFISVMNLVGDYAADPASCMWLFNRSTHNKSLGITEFADASKNGKESTVGSGALTNVLGSDLYVARDLGKTEADGKISATGSNNTLGQFLYVWKPGIQYGYHGTVNIKLFDMGKDGYQLQCWFYVGFDLVQQKASVADSMVGAGINVTL